MRRGEILALQWKNIIFDDSYLIVSTAWKDRNEIGLPKWNNIRRVPLPKIILEKLKDLNSESIRCLPDDLVFCYDDGTRLGDTWWKKRFDSTMKKAGIDKKARNLKPHSFRHTLNTILRDSGADIAKIRATLGWLSEDVQDDYTHWNIEHLQGQAETINNIWQ
jgi:integrase